MKSAKLINKKIEIIETQKPDLNIEGAIIKVTGCGLCGSDLVKIKHSNLKNEDKVVLGHEITGIIEDINCNIKGFKKGDIVSLTHHYPCFDCEYCKNKSYSMCKTFKNSNIYPCGFSEYIRVDKNHLKYTVYKMNESLKDDEKAFLEPLSCCNRAIRRAGFEYGKNKNSNHSTLTIGLGSIGLLMMKALKAFNIKTYGYDISEQRMQQAKNFGFEFDKDKKYDVVFLTAGNSKAVDTALKYVIDGGKIIVFSSVELDNKGFSNNEIYYRELSIIASYSPSPYDIELSANLLNKRLVNVENLTTHYKLDNLAQAVDDSFNNKIFKAYIEI